MSQSNRRAHRGPKKLSIPPETKSSSVSSDPRALALAVLVRIDEGAYANLVLGPMLTATKLDQRDRGFVTELVYGTTRMRRACDYLIDPFLLRPVDPQTRALLRLGAYQLHFMKVPAHAAVSATVAVAPHRTKGFANAILRRVSDASFNPSDLATELSYPDWVVDQLTTDLGADDARDALVQMNEPAEVTKRDDGYTQDLGSQWVAEAVGPQQGERVLDLCAAPGGKATAMAQAGAHVVAADVRAQRAELIASNVLSIADENKRTTGGKVSVVIADGRRPPWPNGTFDRVLVDAPCSGLGVLRRRPDARWRVQPDDADRLASLQRELLSASIGLLKSGGTLVYSVCTLTKTETLDTDDWLATTYPKLEPLPALNSPWRAHGRGSLLLPQSEGTDGMFCLRLVLS